MVSDGGRCVASPLLLQWPSSLSLLLAQRSYYHGRFVLRATDRRERYLHHTRKPAVPPSPYGLRRSVCVFRKSLENTAVVVVVVVAAATTAAAAAVVAIAVAVAVIDGLKVFVTVTDAERRTRKNYDGKKTATPAREHELSINTCVYKKKKLIFAQSHAQLATTGVCVCLCVRCACMRMKNRTDYGRPRARN
jgi:hypothetical protein